MSIPLFSPDYMSSPTAGGAIPPATAQLLANEGRALAQKIEENSLKAEASMKAPAMATAYADAFTRLASGDLSAFGTLEKANALGVGNPFLQSMANDAQRTAGQMASRFFEMEAMNNRFAHQESMFNKEQTAIDLRLEKTQKFQSDRQDDILQRQREDDARAQNAARLTEYEKAKVKHAEEMSAEQRRTELEPGYQPKQIPAPPKPSLIPIPTAGTSTGLPERGMNMNDTAGAPMPSAPLVNETSPKLPNGKRASTIEADGGLFGGSQTSEGMPPASESPAVAPTQAPVSKPTANQPRPQVEERSFGNLVFQLPKTQSNDTEITESVKTATGTVNYKKKQSSEPAAKLANAIAHIEAEDPTFSRWSGDIISKGGKITIRKTGDGKDAAYQPVALYKNGTEEPYGKINPATQQPTGPQTIGKTVYESYVDARALMEGDMKGKFRIYKQTTREQAEFAISRATDRIASGEPPEQVNKELAMFNLSLSPDQIKKALALQEEKGYKKVIQQTSGADLGLIQPSTRGGVRTY